MCLYLHYYRETVFNSHNIQMFESKETDFKQQQSQKKLSLLRNLASLSFGSLNLSSTPISRTSTGTNRKKYYYTIAQMEDVADIELFEDILCIVIDRWNANEKKAKRKIDKESLVKLLIIEQNMNGQAFSQLKKTQFNKILKEIGIKTSVAGQIYANLQSFDVSVYNTFVDEKALRLLSLESKLNKMTSDEQAFHALDPEYEIFEDGDPFLDTEVSDEEMFELRRRSTQLIIQSQSEERMFIQKPVIPGKGRVLSSFI